MRLVLYQDCISPHQIPLAGELVRVLGEKEFRYVYKDSNLGSRLALGWRNMSPEDWMQDASDGVSWEFIEKADVLVTMFRDIDLFRRRSKRGLLSLLQSERWFKPKAGILRMLSPSYRCMARRFVRLLDCGSVIYLPMGIHAASDMARLCGLMHGDLRCLFRAPQLEFERHPTGRFWIKNEPRNTLNTRKYCLDKMRIWGYFVESSKVREFESSKLNLQTFKPSNSRTLKLLWVGRLLDWKRVDTIIRAVGEISTRSTRLNISLDIYGTGSEEQRLKKLSAKYGDIIKFHPPVPIVEVRKLMREHDVYVLASNGYEGWGAVLNEALEEGMKVVGTYEAGASATILLGDDLFHAGDWRSLVGILNHCMDEKRQGVLRGQGIGLWTASEAARRLMLLAARC